MKFKELREALTTTLPWIRNSSDEYTFTYPHPDSPMKDDVISVRFGKGEFQIYEDKEEESVYEIGFKVNGFYNSKYSKGSSISPFVLFSTIIDIVDQHAKTSDREYYIINPLSGKLRSIYERVLNRNLSSKWEFGTTPDRLIYLKKIY